MTAKRAAISAAITAVLAARPQEPPPSGETDDPSLPQYPLANPTGNQTPNVAEFSTCDEFKNLANEGVSNRTIRPAANVTGVLRKSSYTAEVISTASNETWEGNGKVALMCRRAIQDRSGRNKIRRRLLIVPGTYDATPTAKKDIDGLEGGVGGDEPLEEVIYDQCVIGLTNDEVARWKHKARKIRITRSIICFPLYPANHTKSNVHDLGLAVSDGAENVCVDNSLLYCASARMIQCQSALGVRMCNNIVMGWWDKMPATRISGSRSGLADANPTSFVGDGNLYGAVENTNAYRDQVIDLLSIDADISAVYLAQEGKYANHFVKPASDDFSDDPIRVNRGITLTGCSGPNALRTEQPFGTKGLIKMPTETEEQRRFAWNKILSEVGDGSRLAQDVIGWTRAGIFKQHTSPAEFEALYGGPNAQGVPWMGPGSMGHGIV